MGTSQSSPADRKRRRLRDSRSVVANDVPQTLMSEQIQATDKYPPPLGDSGWDPLPDRPASAPTMKPPWASFFGAVRPPKFRLDLSVLTNLDAETQRKKYKVARVLLHDAALRNRQYVLTNVAENFDAYANYPGVYHTEDDPRAGDNTPKGAQETINTGNQDKETKIAMGFFDLPPELRREIYTHLLPPDEDQHNPLTLVFDVAARRFKFPEKPRGLPSATGTYIAYGLRSLLLISPQFTLEFIEYIYSWRGGFHLQDHAYHFLNTIGPDNASHIRRMKLGWCESPSTRESFRALANIMGKMPHTKFVLMIKETKETRCRECIQGIFTMNGLQGRVEFEMQGWYYDYDGVEGNHMRYCDGRCQPIPELTDAPSDDPPFKSNYRNPFLTLPLHIRRSIYSHIISSVSSPAETDSLPITPNFSSVHVKSSNWKPLNSFSTSVTIKSYEFGYRSAFPSSSSYPSSPSFPYSSNPYVGLLFTCKQMYEECHDLIYSSTSFHIPARSLSWFDHLTSERLSALRKIVISYDCYLPKTADISKRTKSSLRHMNAKILMLSNLMSRDEGNLESVELWIQRFSAPFLFYLRHSISRLVAVSKAKNFMADRFGDILDSVGDSVEPQEGKAPWPGLAVKVIAYDYVNDDEVYWTEDITWMVEETEPFAWDCDLKSWNTWEGKIGVRNKLDKCEPMTAEEYESLRRDFM